MDTVFVGDLSIYCTEKDLYELFKSFGPIEEIRLKRSNSDRTSLSYGFVKFATVEQATTAISTMNGYMHLGRGLR